MVPPAPKAITGPKGIGDHADIDFAAALGAGHVLHRHPVDARFQGQPDTACTMSLYGVAHGRGVEMFSATPLYVGLVADVGRVDLQRHGKTNWVAIIIASLAVRASMVLVTGM